MNSEPKLAEVLTDLIAKLLAGDAYDKQTIVQAGATLEIAMAREPETPPKVLELLSFVLESLQSLYEGSVSDPSEAMDAVVAAIAAGGECLADPDDQEKLASLQQAEEKLKEIIGAGESPTKQDTEQEHDETPSETDRDPPAETPDVTEAPPESEPTLPEDADLELLGEFGAECLDHISGGGGISAPPGD